MKNYLLEVKNLLMNQFGVQAQNEVLEQLDQIVITGNQSKLFHIEMGLCQSQKEHCIQQVHHALDTYHHKSMDTEEIKTIVRNVLTNKAPTPEITETVRLLIAD
jgi:isoaspartyl peptidase/L-asparaginase-like protein (Ntn-hydrolase superfamily)